MSGDPSAHPTYGVKWPCGMRDKVIHHYFGVDHEIVRDAATNKVPVLRAQMESILDDRMSGESSGDSWLIADRPA